MLSRRKFLQANAATLALSVPGAATISQVASQAEAEPSAEAKRDYWNDWAADFIARMNAARARRQAALDRLRTEAQVKADADVVRSKVWDLIGGQLEKTPLNPKTVGTIEREGPAFQGLHFVVRPAEDRAKTYLQWLESGSSA